MSNLTPDFDLEVLTPYIRVTKKGNSYTLWVIVPLPMNYYIPLENNPQLDINEAQNIVQVNVDVEGPEKDPADQWYPATLKVDLPSPSGNQFGVNQETTIRVSVLVDDPADTGDTSTQYKDASEEPDGQQTA